MLSANISCAIGTGDWKMSRIRKGGSEPRLAAASRRSGWALREAAAFVSPLFLAGLWLEGHCQAEMEGPSWVPRGSILRQLSPSVSKLC